MNLHRRRRRERDAAGIFPGREPRSVRIVSILTAFLLVLGAFYTSGLILERQKTLRGVSRYNVIWLLSQAVAEIARLEGSAGALSIPGSGVEQATVQLWFDIVSSRIALFDNGDAGAFIATSPDLRTGHAELRDALEEMQPLVDALPDRAAQVSLLLKLRALNPKITRMATASYGHGASLATADLGQLSRLHWIFSGLLVGLLFVGFALMSLLWWHNHQLGRAHGRVNRLVENLKQRGTELVAANERASQAIEEMRSRNAMLQARDEELRIQNTRFDTALNNMSQALCMVDAEQRLIVCNARFTELFGLSSAVCQPGVRAAAVFQAMAEAGHPDPRLVEAIRHAQSVLISDHAPGSFMRESDGSLTLAVTHQPTAGGGWVATYEDVTERQRAAARIHHIAHHEALTNLPNRLLFHQRLREMLRDRRQNNQIALLCLDLDYFKDVNDTLGHPMGDALLRAVANRLRRNVRDIDVVARLGGGEFAILQPSPSHPASAEELAPRIVETVSEPYELDGHRVVIGVSIGITLAADQDANADMLLKCADMALYRAKAEERGLYRFFTAEMDIQSQARRAMELDLREAMDRNEMEVHYQPIVDVTSNRLSGFEALLRWKRTGMVSPAQFIPLAEELGLIIPIGKWVLEQACMEAATWPAPLKIAVNLSPVQFHSESLEQNIVAALERSGLRASGVELEITETALLTKSEKVISTLHRLRSHGLRIALDDFGTGYSSLSYLRFFPFDKLKSDQRRLRRDRPFRRRHGAAHGSHHDGGRGRDKRTSAPDHGGEMHGGAGVLFWPSPTGARDTCMVQPRDCIPRDGSGGGLKG